MILGAWYLMTMLRGLLFGPGEGAAHEGHPIEDLSPREWGLLTPIVVLCVVLGVYPDPILNTTEPDVQRITALTELARVRSAGKPPTSAAGRKPTCREPGFAAERLVALEPPMSYATTLRGERFVFADLRELLAKASEEKSGDQLAGLAARSERERVAAKLALADVPLGEIVDRPLIDPDARRGQPGVAGRPRSRSVAAAALAHRGRVPRILARRRRRRRKTCRVCTGRSCPEVAAATAKLMCNKDLVLAASKIRVVTRCRNTLGQRGVLAVRVQPNHPADDLGGIVLSAVDGLLYGCGDAVLGVNPATESVETVAAILRTLDRLIDLSGAPTQACCLSHITTQLAALDRGAPVDLLFQSIAGTQSANDELRRQSGTLARRPAARAGKPRSRAVNWVGEQVMYFETGQGSALSAEAHHGVDQLTLEARAYGVARLFDPFLINSVVGFIGPEYLFDERQIIRAGLEDHFMGKLLGLPMGVDVCYTNHAAADQNSADNLLLLLGAGGRQLRHGRALPPTT